MIKTGNSQNYTELNKFDLQYILAYSHDIFCFDRDNAPKITFFNLATYDRDI